jgi:ubiquinone/menaquinone biosynthesis C-methylase UbiE
VTQRRKCSSCEHDDLRPFLDLGLSPIADAYTATADEVSKTYPLQLAVCTGCRLVQLLEVVDAMTLFGTGYSFYSSASPPLSSYQAEYAERVLKRYGNRAMQLTVEIGCNDGDMLRHFAAADCKVIGVDPADGPARVAEDRGLRVMNTEFTSKLAHELLDAEGPAGVIIANHVLAHVADVADVLSGIATLLTPNGNGVAFVEVQYVQDLLVNNAFDLVYHEHRQFFSLTSLMNACRRWGLYVINAELTSRQGGSLRVMLSRNRALVTNSRTRDIMDSEWWLNAGLGAYDGMQGRVERVRTRLLDILEDRVGLGLSTGEVLAGYGAPAKATTLLNFCDVDRSLISYVVDTTPAKQGRFIPGTGIEIMAPDTANGGASADTYLLLAWNYARDIISRHPRYVRWIVPIPAPVVI